VAPDQGRQGATIGRRSLLIYGGVLPLRYPLSNKDNINETQRSVTSLLSILFMTFHLTDDILRGMAAGGVSNLVAVPILVLWLYGTLVLAEWRSGYVIILVGSLLGLAVPAIHMIGKGVGGDIAKSSGAFFFVWTLIALGVTALFTSPTLVSFVLLVPCSF